MLWAVGGVELPCVQRWAGRIVVKGFTAPSVANSVKVRFNREKVNSQIPEIQKNLYLIKFKYTKLHLCSSYVVCTNTEGSRVFQGSSSIINSLLSL